MDIFKRKKAQGLSLNVIIVAAIGLLVLVILAVIFIGRAGTTARTVDQCQGDCISDADDCVGQYQRTTSDSCYDLSGDKTDEICCITVA